MRQPSVLITGAAGGLGRVLAADFRADGARLILVDVSREGLDAAFGDWDSCVRVVADLTRASAAREALAPVLRDHSPVTVLCNVAGGFSMGPAVHETPDDAWRRLIELNVATLINAANVVVPGMLAAGYGKVVNVAAASATRGAAATGAYIASKSAVARLTESMALELREQGVNVNAVAPSVIDTPPNRAAMPDADYSRWVTPGKLSNVIRFLASNDADAVHGAVVPVVGLS